MNPDLQHIFRSTRRILILAIFAIAACSNAQGADDKWLADEALGKIKLGRKETDLAALVGKPESKGKDTEWDAIGEWVQVWRFQSQGLTLNMASGSKGGAKTVLTITAEAPSKLATSRGIHIGSTIAEVTKAYGKVQDRSRASPAKLLALVPKVSEAPWERTGEAKLRFGGGRVGMGTAFGVVVSRNGDGVSPG